jgi:hypothetical protein
MTDLVLAYFGPETVMPMTSVIATIAAMVMMFGKTIWRMALGWIGWLRARAGRRTSASFRPHFSSPSGAAHTSGHEEAQEIPLSGLPRQ